jgi:hypothetical protein
MPSRVFLTRWVLKTLQKVPIYAGSVLEGLEDLRGSLKLEGLLNRQGRFAPVSHLLRLC